MASLFESYNARFTDLKTVAKTFVLRQEEFAKLSEHNHSLLIGPRGSGKTTLLKMLKIGAQLARTQANADISSSYMSFSAIYVGADRQLDLLLDEPAAAPSPESRIKTLPSKSLLSIRVKFSCLDTLAEVTDDILTGTPLSICTRGNHVSSCQKFVVFWRGLGMQMTSHLLLNYGSL
jgi:hypothetical protein